MAQVSGAVLGGNGVLVYPVAATRIVDSGPRCHGYTLVGANMNPSEWIDQYLERLEPKIGLPEKVIIHITNLGLEGQCIKEGCLSVGILWDCKAVYPHLLEHLRKKLWEEMQRRFGFMGVAMKFVEGDGYHDIYLINEDSHSVLRKLGGGPTYEEALLAAGKAVFKETEDG